MFFKYIFFLILFFLRFILNPSMDKKLGIIIFKNPNYFTFNLFNFFYSFNIAKKSTNKVVQDFINQGFIRSKDINEAEIDKINEKLLLQNPNNDGSNRFEFEINEDIKIDIKNIFHNYYMDIISEIEKYYNSSIAITNVRIWRNYGFNENETKNKKEFFSNFFHIDAYIGTFFKLYIYLQDVEESHGPVEVHSKKISKIYVKASNYKSRNEYEKINFNETLKLIGKKGQSFIFNPTQFLHRASVPNPGNKRDVICIIFNVVPTIPNKKNYFIFESIYNNIIWKDQSLSKKYGKIYDINNLISFYDSLHKSRIVK